MSLPESPFLPGILLLTFEGTVSMPFVPCQGQVLPCPPSSLSSVLPRHLHIPLLKHRLHGSQRFAPCTLASSACRRSINGCQELQMGGRYDNEGVTPRSFLRVMELRILIVVVVTPIYTCVKIQRTAHEKVNFTIII